MRIVLSLLSLLPLAPAHLGSGDEVQPRDTEAVIESVSPALPPGVRVSIVGGDTFLRVESDGVPVEVRGYDDEQYLRIAADGTVTVNENSATAILNRDRYGRTDGSDAGTPGGPVRWTTIAADGTAMWHDHRIHWMSPSTPRTIDGEGTIQEFSVPIVVDGTTVNIGGTLYLRQQASFLWWMIAPLAAVITVVLSRSRRTRHVSLPVVATVGTVIGWVQHTGLPSGARVTPLLLAFCGGALVLSVVALFTRRNPHVATSIDAGAGAALVVVAWMSAAQVRAAYVPGMGTEWVARATVAALMGAGLAACIDGVVRIVRDTTGDG